MENAQRAADEQHRKDRATLQATPPRRATGQRRRRPRPRRRCEGTRGDPDASLRSTRGEEGGAGGVVSRRRRRRRRTRRRPGGGGRTARVLLGAGGAREGERPTAVPGGSARWCERRATRGGGDSEASEEGVAARPHVEKKIVAVLNAAPSRARGRRPPSISSSSVVRARRAARAGREREPVRARCTCRVSAGRLPAARPHAEAVGGRCARVAASHEVAAGAGARAGRRGSRPGDGASVARIEHRRRRRRRRRCSARRRHAKVAAEASTRRRRPTRSPRIAPARAPARR